MEFSVLCRHEGRIGNEQRRRGSSIAPSGNSTGLCHAKLIVELVYCFRNVLLCFILYLHQLNYCITKRALLPIIRAEIAQRYWYIKEKWTLFIFSRFSVFVVLYLWIYYLQWLALYQMNYWMEFLWFNIEKIISFVFFFSLLLSLQAQVNIFDIF